MYCLTSPADLKQDPSILLQNSRSLLQQRNLDVGRITGKNVLHFRQSDRRVDTGICQLAFSSDSRPQAAIDGSTEGPVTGEAVDRVLLSLIAL